MIHVLFIILMFTMGFLPWMCKRLTKWVVENGY